jgi:Na+-driven multidrug efflux pump
MATMGAIGIGYYLYAPWLMAFFGEDASADPRFLETNRLGVEYMRITVVAYAPAAVGVTIAQALNGAGSTKTPLLLDSIGFLVLQVPIAAFICLRHQEHEYERGTLWWSLVFTTILAAAFYALVWHWGRWKLKRIR